MRKANVFIKARFDDSINEKQSNYNEKLKQRKASWTVDHKWYNYVTRSDACLKVDVDEETMEYLKNLKKEASDNLKKYFLDNDMEELIGSVYFEKELRDSNEYKKFLAAIEEINSESRFTGLWDESGPILMDEEQKKLDEFAKIKNEQLVFEQVFSLDENFMIDNKIVTPSKFYNVVKKQMPSILKNYGFNDPDNINWNVAFHVNTDNLHAHISFWEKKPTFIESKKNGEKKMVFKRKGEITHEKFLFSSFALEKEFVEDNTIRNEIYTLRKQLIEPFNNLNKMNKITDPEEWNNAQQIYVSMQKAISSDKSNMLKLANELVKNRIWYNSKNMSVATRNKINYMSLELINSNPKMKKDFDLFSAGLRIKQSELIELSRPYFATKYPNLFNKKNVTKKDLQEAGIDKDNKLYNVFTFWEEQMYGQDGFFSRVGNQYIKELKKYDFAELDEPLQTNKQIIQKNKSKATALKKSLGYSIFKALDNAEQEALKKFKILQKAIKESQEQQVAQERKK